ncbi:MAG: hypothetical protein KGS61_06335, partial [Verrucomicrobia bacterium]|nr:hypothetical protein [Verrucomicrobiota bacterium]
MSESTTVLGLPLTPAPTASPAPAGPAAAPAPGEAFARRHIGPSPDEARRMLAALGLASLDALVDTAIPPAIRLRRPLQ